MDTNDVITFYQPALVGKFEGKSIGDMVALNLVGRVEELGKDHVRIVVDTALIGKSILTFRQAASQAEEEVARTRLATEPSPG